MNKIVEGFTWLHLWLLVIVGVCLGVGLAYLCPTEMATERGIGAIITAIFIPSYTWFILWLNRKYPSKKGR